MVANNLSPTFHITTRPEYSGGAVMRSSGVGAKNAADVTHSIADTSDRTHRTISILLYIMPLDQPCTEMVIPSPAARPSRSVGRDRMEKAGHNHGMGKSGQEQRTYKGS